MELYFLRHGEADWPDWKKSDEEPPLTKRGKKEMHQIAAFLVTLKVRPNLILTSPWPRAAQTAEIAAEHLETKCREDRRLAPGFGPAELEELIRKNSAESLMIVGHEPDFTKTISALTGASLKLSKAGVALVDVDLSSRKGRLLWVFPPKIAKNWSYSIAGPILHLDRLARSPLRDVLCARPLSFAAESAVLC